ncbi:MAG: hypothetical protein JJU13_13620 [Balneolaceae bacterium]|nr:hypothetical protein [Balneolaceae bacterium]
MRRRKTVVIILIFVFGLTVGCGTESTPVYTLTTSVIGEGAINPSGGDYEEGETINLTAAPSDGWEFEMWSGHLSSEENPLSLVVDQDISLTANFIDIRSVYSVELEITDGRDIILLKLGQNSNPSEINERVPPPPPEGVLHGYLQTEDTKWWSNYQNDVNKKAEWQLFLQMGESEIITINWNLQTQKMPGTLTLSDTDSDMEIDMNQEGSVEISNRAQSTFSIRYDFSIN